MELDKKLLEFIGQSLTDANESISVAESVTSGCLQLAFSRMHTPSLFYKGGITTYTLAEKIKLLKITEGSAVECDGVSESVAQEMALQVAKLFDTDWGIATTGYCSPVRNSCYKVYAYFSFSYKGQIIVTKKLELHNKTQQLSAQLYFTEFILGCFKSHLNQSLMLK
ncbi:nicotinamide-nucleotide amidohydrolase family protein [Chryseobacterium sp.]|uniref:CinA family protein n=1 Tax=Chryseobacterium sp. TaxID=1871047 RepID=UPI00289C381D|nr:nicotinamide-nucleotide amidohydrolase family protein [Chryseobacterium sp.]